MNPTFYNYTDQEVEKAIQTFVGNVRRRLKKWKLEAFQKTFPILYI